MNIAYQRGGNIINKICECGKPIYVKDKCKTCYNKKYRKKYAKKQYKSNNKGMIEGNIVYNIIRTHKQATKDDPEALDLCAEIKKYKNDLKENKQGD